MIRAALRAAGALLVLAGIGLGAAAAIEHGAARAAWARESARLAAGDARYDRDASDARYEQTLALRRRAALLSAIAAPGWVLLALAIGGRETSPPAALTPGRRMQVALLLDASLVASLLLLAASLEAWLGASLAAWSAVAAAQLRAVALAYGWGALACGGSLGGALAGVRVRDAAGRAPGAGRGLAALILAPIALLAAPLALALAPRRRPLHLAWTGLFGVPSPRGIIW